eukprot:4621534-Amphidinium_carterae.1
MKGKRVHAHLAVCSDNGLALGHKDYFSELEKHWLPIMRENPVHDTCALHAWLDNNHRGDNKISG